MMIKIILFILLFEFLVFANLGFIFFAINFNLNVFFIIFISMFLIAISSLIFTKAIDEIL